LDTSTAALCACGIIPMVLRVGWQHMALAARFYGLTIQWGVIPELDSHTPGPSNPISLQSRCSPWHICGPDQKVYYLGMKHSAHFTLGGCVLRLQPGDMDHEAVARPWEGIYRVARSRDQLAFTRARLGFVFGRGRVAGRPCLGDSGPYSI
jgi:hypothetical protein